MMKKVLSLVLAGSMVLSLAACGGSKDTASTTDSSAASSAEASGSDTFKIGATGPITGGAAIYGNAVKNGIQIAVDEINEAGGINGYQIDYNFQDDEHDAEKAVNAYNNLKDWGMQVLIGTTTSAPCIAVVEKTHADNMFQITPSGTAVECVQYDNAYRMCFSDPTQGTESAKYIGENGMAQKVAVIYDSSDVYSTGIYEAFAAEAENQPFDIVSVEAFTADAKTDFSVQVQKSKDAGADLLFMPFYYTEASLVLAECNKQGYEPTFFGCDGMDGILGVENFDTALAEGLTFLAPFVAKSEDEQVQSFVSKYEAAYSETPNQFAADAYDCVYVVKAAIEAAGATPDMSVSDLCDAMKEAMASVSYSGITGKDITWGEDGEPNKAPLVVKVVDGEYTEL
ncbi:ABC transporter substrate-binding protein [Laedolimicola intestinihominis]|uniref:ABC transporter substrate-binding protein n=1 Tax=Laedolimicola intestinihominis TaxID=3133166 RepID=A0ABV1FCQ0_9FIRM